MERVVWGIASTRAGMGFGSGEGPGCVGRELYTFVGLNSAYSFIVSFAPMGQNLQPPLAP